MGQFYGKRKEGEVIDDEQCGSVSGLHEGNCGACLAAEVCNHPCHDWFLEIGLRLRIIDDDVNDAYDSTEEKESRKPSPLNKSQESILIYSSQDQLEDSFDPLLYGKTTTQSGE